MEQFLLQFSQKSSTNSNPVNASNDAGKKDENEYQLKIKYDMTRLSRWTRETLKLFKHLAEKALGQQYIHQLPFLVNLAHLDKFVQDMNDNFNRL